MTSRPLFVCRWIRRMGCGAAAGTDANTRGMALRIAGVVVAPGWAAQIPSSVRAITSACISGDSFTK